MELLKNLLENFFSLANAMSIYILLGLLFAGVLKELLPKDFISKHLGRDSFISVIKATILGIPMPVCSCSVIPLAKSLQREGASKGAVSSFLISTPITGVDSIFATYSFFGLFFTLYRVITSIIIATVTGVLQNLILDKYNYGYKNGDRKNFSLSPMKNSSKGHLSTMGQSLNFSVKSCCSGVNCTTSSDTSTTKKTFKIRRVFGYAFNTLFKDISKSLMVGLILGAFFSTLLPKELISQSGENLFFSYILILLISMPLYVCATSSLPIGASFLISGASVGTVFIFLSAGPATNTVTMSVVKDMFGKRGLLIYILTIAILSITFGYLLDRFFVDFKVLEYIGEDSHFGALDYLFTTIMLALMLYYQTLKFRKSR